MQYYILNMEHLHHMQNVQTLTLPPNTAEEQSQPLVFQLLYVLDGCWQVTVCGEAYTATRDTLLFLPAQTAYTLKTRDTEGSLIRIAFSTTSAAIDGNRLCSHEECLEHLQYYAFAFVQERWAHIPLYVDAATGFHYRSLLEQLYSDYYLPAPGSNLLSTCLLHQLLSRVSADNASACLSLASASSGTSPLIQTVCEYLNTHYTQKITLPELSRQFHLSTNYLCSLFRETTGFSVIEYLNARRVEAAKLHLITTNCRIQDIAQAVGVPDEFYFSRLFKRSTGITPTTFRTRFRKPQQ